MNRATPIRLRVINWLHYLIAICTLLTCAAYFLIESGSGNSFPTYLLALCIFPFAVLQGFSRQTDWKLTGLVAIFLLYLSISVSWSQTGESAIKTLTEALLVFAFCLALPISHARFHWFLNTLMVLTLLSAVVNCGYSIYLHFALPEYQPLPEPRLFAMGRLSNPVVGALSYGFAIILAVYLFMSDNRTMARGAYVFAMVLLLWAIVLTGSRGAYLALAAGVSTGVLLRYPGNRRIQVGGIFATITILAGVAYLFIGPEMLVRRALSFRPEIWTEFVSRALATNPWIGVGMTTDSTFQLPELLIKHPHSVWIATFYYGGTIGLTLLLAVVLKVIASYSAQRETPTRLPGLMLLAFGLTATILDGNELVTKVNYLWFLLWLPVGLAMTAQVSSANRTTQSASGGNSEGVN